MTQKRLMGVLFSIGIVLIISTLILLQEQPGKQTGTVRIKNHQWTVEYALTEEQRALGLGQRKSIPESTGMLFLFPRPDLYRFWMKDMEFPLDFIFVANGKVESVLRDIEPDDSRIFMPNRPVDVVLEVNAGETTGIQPEDDVQGLPFIVGDEAI